VQHSVSQCEATQQQQLRQRYEKCCQNLRELLRLLLKANQRQQQQNFT